LHLRAALALSDEFLRKSNAALLQALWSTIHGNNFQAHMPIAHLLKESVDQLNNYTPSLTWKISRF